MSIYIIKSKDLSLHDCYIGSCKNMRNRMVGHKYSCNNENSKHYNINVYQFIRANGGWDNFEMVQIASVWNKATKSLVEIEQDYIDYYKSNLNMLRAYLTDEQKKEEQKERHIKYSENNRDMLLKYYREYYYSNRENLLEKCKKYQDKNKDKIIDYKKNYYIKNANKLKERFNCECGGKYTQIHKARHFNSKKHKSFIENN